MTRIATPAGECGCYGVLAHGVGLCDEYPCALSDAITDMVVVSSRNDLCIVAYVVLLEAERGLAGRTGAGHRKWRFLLSKSRYEDDFLA